ncbi:transcriptional regulator [Alicyclobacillus cellulosilyticus]|uniref:Transcriptional regulator n=1 Tax=Alicyclobacillus cellulosilyticus TaxID=1003997 RepID=A0A917NN74_9BACL|nr:MerR family transcriptional regulator [Alicyclobacillus cellulosilyticus]GGJ13353.1 transcriptional regulator [Alicyclobacillus cellulosilyticus]
MDLSERRQLPLFSIGVVQKLTGLSARQIRYYEQHGLVTPARSEGKQRLFSFADVERLMEIRRLLDEGLNMAKIKERLMTPYVTRPAGAKEPTDEELYKRLQQELLEGPVGRTDSLFQGDLSRFYRRR